MIDRVINGPIKLKRIDLANGNAVAVGRIDDTGFAVMFETSAEGQGKIINQLEVGGRMKTMISLTNEAMRALCILYIDQNEVTEHIVAMPENPPTEV